MSFAKYLKKALLVGIRKPTKPTENSKSYDQDLCSAASTKSSRGLSMPAANQLSMHYFMRNRMRYGKSVIDQVVLLIQNTEESFKVKKKAADVFVDLTGAYDPVWHHGIIFKLLRLLPDKHMVRMILELVCNKNFTLNTSESKKSRLHSLRNNIPERLILAPLYS